MTACGGGGREGEESGAWEGGSEARMERRGKEEGEQSTRVMSVGPAREDKVCVGVCVGRREQRLCQLFRKSFLSVCAQERERESFSYALCQ